LATAKSDSGQFSKEKCENRDRKALSSWGGRCLPDEGPGCAARIARGSCGRTNRAFGALPYWF